jgi:RNA recognition motif-containing protein
VTEARSTKQLFLGGVAYRATEQDIFEALENAGISINGVRLGKNHDTGQSRGFAFIDVSMSEPRSLAELIAQLNGITICGRACRVEMVNAIPSRPDRAGRSSREARAPEPRTDSDSWQRRRREEHFERPWRDSE